MKNIIGNKLKIFLHDPPDKPFILMKGGSHEERAKALAQKLGVTLSDDLAPDHIASAMERCFLPKNASKIPDL